MKSSIKNSPILPPPPRILTRGRAAVLLLGLFLLTANLMADPIIQRFPEGSNTPNYTGTDLKEVQTAPGAADGDVITISEDITVGETIRTGYDFFTLRSATESSPVTITSDSHSDLYDDISYYGGDYTFKDVNFSGFDSVIGGYRGHEIFAQNVSFTSNSTGISANNLLITGYDENSIISFVNNDVAIHTDFLLLSTGQFYFTGNQGGALKLGSGRKILETGQFYFSENSSNEDGGAIYATSGAIGGDLEILGTVTFTGNSSQQNGGAIFAGYVYVEGSTATFTGNTAANRGNDIYAENGLYFYSGTYYFDGGIYSPGITEISGGQVTFAGRENDTTNEYLLGDAYIVDGGNLTVKLDEIDSLTGFFNVGLYGDGYTDTGALDLNVAKADKSLALSDALTITSSSEGTALKSGAGTLKINAPAGCFNVTNFTVTDGRLDFLGHSTGAITVEDAVFSPGNSIGEATLGGGLTLSSANSKLLLEIGGKNASQNDSLVAEGELKLNEGQIYLELADAADLPYGERFTAVLHGSNSADLASDENFISKYIRSIAFTDLRYELVDGKYAITGTISPSFVPEPAAWILLLLGTFGLMYWRKK